MVTDTDRAEGQAKSQLESIIEMVNALNTDDDDAREEAMQTIQEDPLSVQVRSGWHTPFETLETAEYEILLCTGGPAVRLIGELEGGEPYTVRLQYQDRFTPWTELITTGTDHGALLAYARQFYFA